ncbi:MAG: adenosine deaminase [Anaerolineae bacterium]|nr:adenosine deaminase [Anaerolineae bacterium]
MDSNNGYDFKLFPKVELHRHLEGSLRLSTLNDIVHQFNLPFSAAELQHLVQMQPDDTFSMQNFLSKFQNLRGFYLSPEIIRRIAYETIADAARDGIRYIEVMFTPAALARTRSYPLNEVIEWVLFSAQQASHDYHLPTRFIISFNRHESPDLAAYVTELAIQYRQHGIVAINLAGNEAEYPASPFRQIFTHARNNDLGVTIHAGEWNNAANIRDAILDYNADRIGHGIHILEDPQLVKLARDRQTPFEVCLTSNLQTGAVTEIGNHPIKQMLDAGLNVTLNTDDPAISGITLSGELQIAHEKLGLSFNQLTRLTLAAVENSFLSPVEKQNLLSGLKNDIQMIHKFN